MTERRNYRGRRVHGPMIVSITVVLVFAGGCSSGEEGRNDSAGPGQASTVPADAGSAASQPTTTAKGKGTASVTKTDEKVTIPSDLLFGFDSADLTADVEPVLTIALELTTRFPKGKFTVEGHTDNVGSASYNLQLSRRRAATVANWLQARGVDTARMTLHGWGAERPIADNNTPEGRQRNRRVEISLLSKT